MASLETNSSILGTKNAKHFIRRITFKYNKELIDQIAQLTASEAFDFLSNNTVDALTFPYDPTPLGSPDGYWVNSSQNPSSFGNQEDKNIIVSGWWWFNALTSQSVKYKLTHFLSTRYTVSKNNVFTSSNFYDYLKLLEHYSLGNYKTLAKKITLNNAMLHYLNNNNNTKQSPNENYAREFLELFTIGKGNQIGSGDYSNYTEEDIVQAAKVLTGIISDDTRSNIDNDTGIPQGFFMLINHDTNSKTFSYAFDNITITGAQNESEMQNELNEFIEMIFSKSATAITICKKIYSYFVSTRITEEIETDIIIPLAEELKNNNYELLPTLKRLVTSLHFFDLDDSTFGDEINGGLIKSPLQQITEIYSFFKISFPNPVDNPYDYYITFWKNFIHNSFLKQSNMLLFQPPNVAGHQAYYQMPEFDKNWISASTFRARFKIGISILEGKNRVENNDIIYPTPDLALQFTNNNIVTNVTDPYLLTKDLCDFLFGQETDNDRVNYFMNTFLLQGQPPDDWTSVWEFYIAANFNSVVNLRLNALISNILKAPETLMF